MRYLNIYFSIVVFMISNNVPGSECYQSTNADTSNNHRFQYTGRGIVTDARTGLTWMRCPLGMQWDNNNCLDVPDRKSWNKARIAIIVLNNEGGGYAGFRDWRLPTLEELNTLVEQQCYGPAINSEIFPDTPSIGFWTSTRDPIYRHGAWLVYFLHGNPYMGSQGYEWAVRAVRK